MGWVRVWVMVGARVRVWVGFRDGVRVRVWSGRRSTGSGRGAGAHVVAR